MAAAVASGCFAPREQGRSAEFRPLVVFVGVAFGAAEPGFGSGSVEAADAPWPSVVVPQAWIAAVAAGIDAQG